jgi:hypothetical protein
MKTDFDNLKLNQAHSFSADSNSDKQVVKVYREQQLIAKKIKLKKSIRYFAIQGYQQFLTEEN